MSYMRARASNRFRFKPNSRERTEEEGGGKPLLVPTERLATKMNEDGNVNG